MSPFSVAQSSLVSTLSYMSKKYPLLSAENEYPYWSSSVTVKLTSVPADDNPSVEPVVRFYDGGVNEGIASCVTMQS